MAPVGHDMQRGMAGRILERWNALWPGVLEGSLVPSTFAAIEASGGPIQFVRALARVFLWTVLCRGAVFLLTKLLLRRWPEAVDAIQEVERYGWWLSLVIAMLITAL